MTNMYADLRITTKPVCCSIHSWSTSWIQARESGRYLDIEVASLQNGASKHFDGVPENRHVLRVLARRVNLLLEYLCACVYAHVFSRIYTCRFRIRPGFGEPTFACAWIHVCVFEYLHTEHTIRQSFFSKFVHDDTTHTHTFMKPTHLQGLKAPQSKACVKKGNLADAFLRNFNGHVFDRQEAAVWRGQRLISLATWQ